MERKYVIPLRKECAKVPLYAKTRKAVKATKIFLKKHMKTENVKLGKYLNEALWARGNRHPPARVEVIVTKFEDKDKGVYVVAELVNAPVEVKKEAPKKKGLANKLKDKLNAEEKAEAKETAKELDKKPIGKLSKEEAIIEEEKLLEKEEHAGHPDKPKKAQKFEKKQDTMTNITEESFRRDKKK
ncbi:MAG: 50S ribosomal protein L31e [Nanoarchaeota archaeon]